MDLAEFYDYKNLLMKTLCSDQEIVQLVTGNEDARVPNHELPYTQLFSYEFIPETVSEAKTFICFDVDIVSVPNKTYYMPVLYIWMFTHKSNIRMEKGGLLLDRLCVAVNRLLNGSRFFGLGHLKLDSVERFVPIADYLGRAMTFYAIDFNRYTAGDKTPGNRKRGY